ncbi:MAG: glycosyltransferase family 9 protein [Thermoanaerobaculia bacterium]
MGPSRILLLRTSALGDVVHALPVLTALRRNLPHATLGWVVESSMAPLLAGHPDLDELLVVSLRTWRRQLHRRSTWAAMRDFFVGLERFAPELVLDLMGNHKAGALAALTLADRRVGVAPRFRREPSSSIWINEPVIPQGEHSVDRALAVLDALDLPREPADFGGGKLLREEPIEARDRLASTEDQRALIQPGAGWGNKRYPPERWGQAAHLLERDLGLRSWVAAGPGEENLANEVVAASRGSAEAIVAPTLAYLATFLRHSRLVIGGDTGPVHLAHALETTVLCLMGPTAPETNGPYGDREAALWRQLPCSFCHKRFNEAKLCLTDIQPAEIAERARFLLQRHPAALTP